GELEHTLPADRHAELGQHLRHLPAALESPRPESSELGLKVLIGNVRQVAEHMYLVALDVRAQLHTRNQREARVLRRRRSRLGYPLGRIMVGEGKDSDPVAGGEIDHLGWCQLPV